MTMLRKDLTLFSDFIAETQYSLNVLAVDNMSEPKDFIAIGAEFHPGRGRSFGAVETGRRPHRVDLDPGRPGRRRYLGDRR
jgi:hypothetical protein